MLREVDVYTELKEIDRSRIVHKKGVLICSSLLCFKLKLVTILFVNWFLVNYNFYSFNIKKSNTWFLTRVLVALLNLYTTHQFKRLLL